MEDRPIVNAVVAQASCLWGEWASRPFPSDCVLSGKMPDGPTGKMPVLQIRLFALRPHDNRGDIRGIDGGVEKFSAGQLRKVHQLVSDLFDLAADLLAGFHPQLHDLSDVFLENSQDRIAGLQIDFALRENIRASERDHEADEK